MLYVESEENEEEEDLIDGIPKTLRKTRKVNGVTFLAGVGNRDARVMFIVPVVHPDEASDKMKVGYDRYTAKKPEMLACAEGIIFKDLARREGIMMEDCYFTAIVKSLPEKRAHQIKPPNTLIAKYKALLDAEIKEVKPDIIVTVGKIAFDNIMPIKAKADDLNGVWFHSDKYNCRVYAMPPIKHTLKPDYYERFRLDFVAVKRMLDSIDGITVDPVPLNYRVLSNSADLEDFVDEMEANNRTVLSVDCEWHGCQHVDGNLRSMQLGWAPGEAVYIRFMDDQLNYVFDVSYADAGTILGRWLNRPEVKYIGHHISADFPWMSHWLGLEWYKKALFDSEFALQSVDESYSRGLESLALMYTDLGRYDWDLIVWKKKNGRLCDGGYGYIPDDILIPYACKDVDVVVRSYPIVMKKLEQQDLVDYYTKLLNPFVTDVFTSFCIKGVPVNRPKMDEMRKLFNYALVESNKELQKSVHADAKRRLLRIVLQESPTDFGILFAKFVQFHDNGDPVGAKNLMKQISSPTTYRRNLMFLEYYLSSLTFNRGSKPQILRFLFGVRDYEPIKSTDKPDHGLPSIAWTKVLEYPPEKQKEYTPATDKETLEILASENDDPLIRELLQVNAIGTVCKSFLRMGEVDKTTGELVSEQGLHYYLATDDAIHLNHSCTETGEILIA